MLIHMVKFIVLWINSLPSNGGLSTTISTREIIKITTLYFKRHFKVEFGAYCKTHEDNSPTNTMLVHTNGGIGLGLSNNRQCGYKLLCLSHFYLIGVVYRPYKSSVCTLVLVQIIWGKQLL